MILKINSLIIFLAVVSTAFSQRDLSATQAVFIALEKNYQIIISEKQYEIGKKNNKWSEAGLFPAVTLNIGQNNVIQDNTNNPFTFTPGIVLSQSVDPSLSTDWNIFSGFQVKMSKQRLMQLEEQSENNALAIIETTIQDVLKAYYTAQLQNDRRQLFHSILDLSRERYSYYELKEKYSNSNSLELLQFKNQYLTDSTNLLLQEISYNNSLRNLGILMNDSTLVENEINLIDKIDVAIVNIHFEDAKNEMFANNKNLKNQYIALELQKTNTAFSRSFLYPTLSFQAGINPGWSNLRQINNDQLQIETNTLVYYGNFSLRYSLFNNWKNKRAVEVSKIQEEIAALNIESMKQTLSSTLKNMIEMYHARIQLVSISEENLIYAEMAFELAQKRFDLGTINSIDLASFQNTYQNTMIQHYENLFNKLDVYLEINKMTGQIGLEYTSQK